MSRCGEDAGTATISYSPVSLAMGVACAIDTGDWFQMIASSLTRPLTSSALPSPRRPLMNRASPIVPAAPGTFST
jgi:hypothetical protein